MTIKLHFDIVHLVGYNVIVYQIMLGMSNDDDDDDDNDDDEPCKVWISTEIKWTWNFNSTLIM